MSIFMRGSGLQFSCHIMSLFAFGIRVILTSRMNWDVSPTRLFSGRVHKGLVLLFQISGGIY